MEVIFGFIIWGVLITLAFTVGSAVISIFFGIIALVIGGIVSGIVYIVNKIRK